MERPHLEDWERIFDDSFGPMGGPLSVYRELRLPEAALIEFDLPHRRIDDLTLRLGLGTYRTLFAESHHEVSWVGSEVRVRQFWGSNGHGPATSLRLAPNPSGATRVQIAVNRAEGLMVLCLDGKIVLRALAAPADPSAHSLVLTAGNRMDPRVREMPIRTLLVSRLGGGLQVPGPKPEEDTVRFANAAVDDGSLTNLPPRSPRADDDVRVMLVHGEQLTLSATQLDERGLTGTSGALGPVRIAADAVRIIDFRPMDPLRGP